tara:strand:- start:179 stop:646 length:468 start_codon:yes stop_codon:yes gene_type:complete
MKEIEISLEMIDKARKKADEMGVIRNSILRGDGSIAGFIGEQIALQVLGGTWENTYDYDLITPDGKKIDVKTKQTSVKPLPEYDCSISKSNTKQKCDAYAFVRIKGNLTVGWYLGMLDKKEYFEKARFFKKGEVDTSNGYKVRADCHNVKIFELN